MSILPMVPNPSRASWLEERRSMLTASDVAAVLGLDPRKGPVAVYADKMGAYALEDSYVLRRGRLHENAIAEEYAEETGRTVEDVGAYTIQRHPDIRWLGATLDRVISTSEKTPAPAAGKGTLQIKLGLGSGRDWKEGIPDHYRVQVQVEMACFHANWGAICALTGPGPLYCEDLLPDPDFWRGALPILEAFWHRVKRREPPTEADALDSTGDALKALYKEVPGTKTLLPQGDEDVFDEWLLAKESEKKAAAEVKRLGNTLRLHIGDASYGELPSGRMLSLMTVNVKPAEVPRGGYSYRKLVAAK